MIVVIVNLLLIGYTKSMLLPVVCSSLALLFFIGYSIWLWLKKPKSIVINDWLSNINGIYTFYFLVISVMDTPGKWWWITPIVLSVVVLFLSLINNKDEIFKINEII